MSQGAVVHQNRLSRNELLIRDETESDHDEVRAVNISAFDTDAEAGLVDALRCQVTESVSLVAKKDDLIIGHIFFSPVSLSGYQGLKLMGLAPIAVMPGHQKQGVGSALVREGLDECRRRGAVAAVVLGHPQFYPRFGFTPSSRFGIASEYDVPDDVFMAIELQPDALRGKTGTVRYHSAFGNV